MSKEDEIETIKDLLNIRSHFEMLKIILQGQNLKLADEGGYAKIEIEVIRIGMGYSIYIESECLKFEFDSKGNFVGIVNYKE